MPFGKTPNTAPGGPKVQSRGQVELLDAKELETAKYQLFLRPEDVTLQTWVKYSMFDKDSP